MTATVRASEAVRRDAARVELGRQISRAETSANLQHRSVSTLLLMGEVDAAGRAARQAQATDRHAEDLRGELRSLR